MAGLGPHAVFIWTSYAFVGAGLAGLLAWVLLDGRRQRARLEELERRGLGRRVEPPAASGAVDKAGGAR